MYLLQPIVQISLALDGFQRALDVEGEHGGSHARAIREHKDSGILERLRLIVDEREQPSVDAGTVRVSKFLGEQNRGLRLRIIVRGGEVLESGCSSQTTEKDIVA